jgi:hypothetical protein
VGCDEGLRGDRDGHGGDLARRHVGRGEGRAKARHEGEAGA